MKVTASVSGGWSASFGVTASWSTVVANFTRPPGATTLNATLTIATGNGGGGGGWSLGSVSLTPVANTWRGLRLDVVNSLKATEFKGLFRYPGGCYAPFYRWKVGLLDADMRPPIETPPGYCDAVAVSPFLACIGSPCLRHRVHGASIGRRERLHGRHDGERDLDRRIPGALRARRPHPLDHRALPDGPGRRRAGGEGLGRVPPPPRHNDHSHDGGVAENSLCGAMDADAADAHVCAMDDGAGT
eukprot:COSAG01_NODE_5356_length_4313_cov_1.986711_3_plen_244_part_00